MAYYVIKLINSSTKAIVPGYADVSVGNKRRWTTRKQADDNKKLMNRLFPGKKGMKLKVFYINKDIKKL